MVQGIPIKSLHRLITQQPIIVRAGTPIEELARKILIKPVTHSFYVVDEKDKLVGKITLKNLVEHLFGDMVMQEHVNTFMAVRLALDKTAGDIMVKPIFVTQDNTLKDAFKKMHKYELNELPVVDDQMHVVGDLNMIELLAALVEKRAKQRGEQYLKTEVEMPFFNILGSK